LSRGVRRPIRPIGMSRHGAKSAIGPWTRRAAPTPLQDRLELHRAQSLQQLCPAHVRPSLERFQYRTDHALKKPDKSRANYTPDSTALPARSQGV
jgi:hypothetical protein